MNVATSLLAVGLLAGLHFGTDAPQLNGVRVEMTKVQVHAVLNKVAAYKSQDENQEVWVTNSDSSIQWIIVGYAPDDHVRYVTLLPKTQGQLRSCKPLGEIKKAKVAGTTTNAVYTRSWKENDGKDEFVASARVQTGRMTSCSIKKLGVGMENEGEERLGKKHA